MDRFKSVNKKRIEERIRLFLKETVGTGKLLPAAPKLSSIFDARGYIGTLFNELTKIDVVE